MTAPVGACRDYLTDSRSFASRRGGANRCYWAVPLRAFNSRNTDMWYSTADHTPTTVDASKVVSPTKWKFTPK